MPLRHIFKGNNPFIILILLTPLLLNIIWFRSGNIMGVAESGLPFYNFQIAYESNQSAWNDYALGFPTNISISAKPSYWLLMQLQNAAIPGFILQAIFLWITFVLSGLSIYFITKNLFPQLGNKLLFLAVLFYWFNPFTMVNVWNRFLNNFFVFYMLLPVCFLFFIKGMQTRRYYYALFIGLASTVLSYALSSVAFIMLLWSVMFYTAFFYIFIHKEFKDRFFIIKFFLLALLFWCLSNLWWISQVFSYVYSGSFSVVEQNSFTPNINQQILTNISQRLGNLIYIFRFEHGSFFSSTYNLDWVGVYIFPLIALLCFIPVLVILLPLFSKKKEFSVLFLSGLFILGVFLAKGNNPPFGELLNFFFTRVGFLQPFRNAFEKFGFLLPLTGAPLFAYGVYILEAKIAKWKDAIFSISLFWSIAIFGFPFWTGLVFTSNEFPANVPSIGYQVQVPTYYKEAAQWLSQQEDNFRLLVFPLGNEGITYNWEKGFIGVELSNQLLPTTSVSFQTNIPFYEDISEDLERTLLSENDFTIAANLLNAKFIVTRSDIDWHNRSMRDPQNIFNKLKDKQEFKIVKEFGGLIFWENLNWVDRKIYVSNQAIKISPQPKISDSQFLSRPEDVLLGYKTSVNLNISREIIYPDFKLSLKDKAEENFEGDQNTFPHTRFSPTSKIYKFLRFKEDIDIASEVNIPEKVNLLISLLGKRLVEARSSAEINNTSGILIAINEYQNILEENGATFSEYKEFSSGKTKQVIKQEQFYRIFVKHRGVLKDLTSRFSENNEVIVKLQQALGQLDSVLVKENIQPQFGFLDKDNFPIRERAVYKFNVTDNGEYEILWGDSDLEKYYKDTDKEIILQLNDKLVSANATPSLGGLRSLGRFNFSAGVHEISINTPEQINLVNTPLKLDLVAHHGEEKRTFPMKEYDPYTSYTLSFDYLIKRGLGVETFIESNNARIEMGKIIPSFLKGLAPDSYDFEEKSFSTSFLLSNTVDAASLNFIVKPWNDCRSIFFTNRKERCKDESFRRPYDRTTEVSIKNISLVRNLEDEPILVKTGTMITNNPPQIDYKKVNNTEYIVTIQNAQEPYVLVLSELYDPGWGLLTKEGKRVESNHFIANAYANGWQIDKGGNYELILKFVPQDLINPTEKISQWIFILGTLLIFWKLRKKHG